MDQTEQSGRKRLRRIARWAMVQRGLLADFSPEIMAEVGAIHESPAMPDASIRDMRGMPWVSIDNDDSRDLDQLSVAENLPNGEARLFVAVADVDCLVRASSATDGHARVNTTSVYTVAEIFPMLPERLSTDLTSLNEDQDRLAMVVEMTLTADGKVRDSSVYRAIVKNTAKLAYNGVADWLEGAAEPPRRLAGSPLLQEQVQLQDRVAQMLRAWRFRKGALGLKTEEALPIFDGDILTGLAEKRQTRADELIEDVMVAANRVVTKFLESKGYPTLRRILRSPERWERIVQLAKSLGENLSAEASPEALAGFLERRRVADPEHFEDLSFSVVKLLGRGEYALALPGQKVDGHFGLAIRRYSHATAPNRRFPDLITQRLLKAALAGKPAPYSNEELSEMARQCTEQENNANKVERQVRKSAAALLLEHRLGEVFDATVTGAAAKGTWVGIRNPRVEGRLTGDASGLDVGDAVRVKLVKVDVENGYIDFARGR